MFHVKHFKSCEMEHIKHHTNTIQRLHKEKICTHKKTQKTIQTIFHVHTKIK